MTAINHLFQTAKKKGWLLTNRAYRERVLAVSFHSMCWLLNNSLRYIIYIYKGSTQAKTMRTNGSAEQNMQYHCIEGCQTFGFHLNTIFFAKRFSKSSSLSLLHKVRYRHFKFAEQMTFRYLELDIWLEFVTSRFCYIQTLRYLGFSSIESLI